MSEPLKLRRTWMRLLIYYDKDESESRKRGGGRMLMALFEPTAVYSVRCGNINPNFIQDLTQKLGLK
jgi:hypothetical protein